MKILKLLAVLGLLFGCTKFVANNPHDPEVSGISLDEISSSSVSESSSSLEESSSSTPLSSQVSSSSATLSSSSSRPVSSSSLFVELTFTCSQQNLDADLCGTFEDERDNAEYSWVLIDGVKWMAQNLNHGSLVNLTEPLDGTNSEKSCLADFSDNCIRDGALYTWAAAMALNPNCGITECIAEVNDPHQGICPNGWHIPDFEEWASLKDFVDNNNGDSPDDAGRSLKSGEGWNGTGEQGKDSFGFNALATGFRNGAESVNDSTTARWWTATGAALNSAFYTSLSGDDSDLGQSVGSKDNLRIQVRCVED
jgi:uncharacterized protein (TIGR02145 family)